MVRRHMQQSIIKTKHAFQKNTGRCALITAALVAGFLFCTGCQNSGPVISWTSPGDGADVYGVVLLKAAANANRGIASIGFYIDEIDEDHRISTADASGDTAATCAADWYTAEVQNGTHTLYAVITDAEADTASASLTVTVGNITRSEAIPEGAIKMTPATDQHPPVLEQAFSDRWEDPVPLGAPVNTAGGEDSPFITPDGTTLYFWFTPDVSVPAQEQVGDRVTGVYYSEKTDGVWGEPQRIFLEYCDEPALDGCQTVSGTTMWFCTARAGNYRDLDMWTARLQNGRWAGWVNAGELLNKDYEIGELHLSAGEDEIYFDSSRAGGKGGKDIWVTRRENGVWQEPVNIEAVNTEYHDGWPFVSQDGTELWFTRAAGVPEIWRSVREIGVWQEPEKVLSSFAGEPALDNAGNIYFAHHFWDDATNSMIEADYYVCYRKKQ